ncbi:hypothetical protein J8273_5767 [Carpediemonas membranifera]|uniref:THH1/TOM1/TOM3 domain-containing protein n=1 Tax=Carpediemonas membranifera TaxID=201153 RepID=A0A8J6B4J0_9EUKA|nr:hypothetical protein J8273_5767 [Carpediemonas membranifera]|eukprot:KAG9392834.1 hypothetical protein J8273_5767 [Carpediemonas membranifera]
MSITSTFHLEWSFVFWSFFSVMTIGSMMYAALLIAAVVVFCSHAWQFVRGRKPPFIPLLASSCVAIFALCRFVNSFLHVIRLYVPLFNFVKHLLFVVPIGLLFFAFSLVIHVWHSFLYNTTHLTLTKSHHTVLVLNILFNIAIFILLLADTVLYLITSYGMDRMDYQLRCVGASNILTAVVYYAMTIFYLFYGVRLLFILRKSISNLRMVVFRIALLTVVGSTFFVMFATFMLVEGCYLLYTGRFYYTYCVVYWSYCEYVTYWYLELLYIVLQITPAAMVLMLFAKRPWFMRRGGRRGGRGGRSKKVTVFAALDGEPVDGTAYLPQV